MIIVCNIKVDVINSTIANITAIKGPGVVIVAIRRATGKPTRVACRPSSWFLAGENGRHSARPSRRHRLAKSWKTKTKSS